MPGPWTGVGLPPAGPGSGVSQSARGADRGQRQCPESRTAGRGAALGGVCEADDCVVLCSFNYRPHVRNFNMENGG